MHKIISWMHMCVNNCIYCSILLIFLFYSTFNSLCICYMYKENVHFVVQPRVVQGHRKSLVLDLHYGISKPWCITG